MSKLKIKINLDPIEDGIENLECFRFEEELAGMIVSTTGSWKAIHAGELTDVLERLAEIGEVTQLGEYWACFNSEKVLSINGDRYFIGSVVVLKEENEIPLTKEDINSMVQEVTNRLVEIIINGESVWAYAID